MKFEIKKIENEELVYGWSFPFGEVTLITVGDKNHNVEEFGNAQKFKEFVKANFKQNRCSIIYLERIQNDSKRIHYLKCTEGQLIPHRNNEPAYECHSITKSNWHHFEYYNQGVMYWPNN